MQLKLNKFIIDKVVVLIDDYEEIHASPFYVIYDVNRICQLFTSLAMVIFACTSQVDASVGETTILAW